MKRLTFVRNAPALLALTALTTGCSTSNTQDLQTFVTDTRNQQSSRIEPLPEFKPYETFLYQASNLRNPFAPRQGGQIDRMLESDNGPGIRPDANRPREALEEFPLDTLRMVGTLGQGGTSWALVQTSDNTIHRVQPGNYLGQNHGKILHIDEYEIELMEIVPDGLGGWMERSASLALSE